MTEGNFSRRGFIERSTAAMIGANVMGALSVQAKYYVFLEVQAEVEQRAADDEHERATAQWNAGDRRTSDQLAADDAGVTRLFR